MTRERMSTRDIDVVDVTITVRSDVTIRKQVNQAAYNLVFKALSRGFDLLAPILDNQRPRARAVLKENIVEGDERHLTYGLWMESGAGLRSRAGQSLKKKVDREQGWEE